MRRSSGDWRGVSVIVAERYQPRCAGENSRPISGLDRRLKTTLVEVQITVGKRVPVQLHQSSSNKSIVGVLLLTYVRVIFLRHGGRCRVVRGGWLLAWVATGITKLRAMRSRFSFQMTVAWCYVYQPTRDNIIGDHAFRMQTIFGKMKPTPITMRKRISIQLCTRSNQPG